MYVATFRKIKVNLCIKIDDISNTNMNNMCVTYCMLLSLPESLFILFCMCYY